MADDTQTFDPQGELLHPDTNKLVDDFAAALKAKLIKAQQKYGYSDTWKSTAWRELCLEELRAHMGKGDPRDVAAYCAFMWYHGWGTDGSEGHNAGKV